MGSVNSIPCKVRLVAATNRDLLSGIHLGGCAAIQPRPAGRDRFFLPPLRERRGRTSRSSCSTPWHARTGRYRRAWRSRCSHTWPFNIRELFKVAAELRVRGAGAKMPGLELIEPRPRAP